MAKKPQGRLLFTWNEKKDPEIKAFFDEIEEGMYSYSLRQVIKWYMANKQQKGMNISNDPNIENHVDDTPQSNPESRKDTVQEEKKDDAYDDFDPDVLG